MEAEKSNSKDQNRIGVRGILFVENLFCNRMISDWIPDESKPKKSEILNEMLKLKKSPYSTELKKCENNKGKWKK